MTFAEVFVSFWWLIFPLMAFALGGFGMVLRHRQNQKALDILKTYAAQGKDPPPEVIRAVYGHQSMDGSPFGPGPNQSQTPGGLGPQYGPADYGLGWSGPWGTRGWSSLGYWWGPVRSWRRFITLGALSVGFGIAAWYQGPGEPAKACVLTAIILGVLSIAALMNAILMGFWKPR